MLLLNTKRRGRKNMKKQPVTIRTSTLSDVLDTIQDIMEQIGGEKQKGAEIALNAIRKKFGIPVSGEQIDLFEDEEGR
jgi:hypothetical protein